MKKPQGKIDIKRLTRLTTLAVASFALFILVLTAWFIMRSLNEVSVAKTSDGQKTPKIEGVNNPLLEKVQAFMDSKKADAIDLGPDVRDPFKRPTAPVAPAPTPAPAPEEGTPPAPAPTP